MVTPVLSSSADFSIFNTGWNGTSNLAVSTYSVGKFSPSFELRSTGSEVSFVQMGLEDLELNPASEALAIIGPTEAFSSSEGALVGDFVRAGGNLLLADDFGSANTLLETMNAGSRFSGKLVIDLCFDKSPEFPICFDIVDDALTKNITSLQLNYATSLNLGGSAEPLVRTSIASWSDIDGDRMQDFGEPSGPFVILAREHLGSGEIVLLSDPSVLMNGMSGYLDNELLSSNIVAVICEGRSGLYFDESHRDYFDPVTISTEIADTVPGNVKALLFAVAFVLALWIATDVVDRTFSWTRDKAATGFSFVISKILRRRAKATEREDISVDEIVRELSESHPDWRRGLIRYVIKEKQRHDAGVEKRS
ncbi:MAG: hypothetical protein JSV94_04335 [Methanobacteriota archaeon]|nr:MAG: hypothetical protein JSV94_04335 [Euryarchaeota archaeon]